MSFIDARINDKVDIGFVGGPAWQTLVVPLASGTTSVCQAGPPTKPMSTLSLIRASIKLIASSLHCASAAPHRQRSGCGCAGPRGPPRAH